MDFYFVPNNLENACLVSANGVTHYHIVTSKPTSGIEPTVTTIQRPSSNPAKTTTIVEIEWKTKDMPSIIRSPLLSGMGYCVGTKGVGVKTLHYLYKKHRFSPCRYFVGDDALEYRWKMNRVTGCTLMRTDTNDEIASSLTVINAEGIFAGERKEVLRIQPSSIDIDLIVITFLIMERKRREKYGCIECLIKHDEDPQGEGGSGDGDGVGEADSGLFGEL